MTLDLGMSHDGHAHVITRLSPDHGTAGAREHQPDADYLEEWATQLRDYAKHLRPRRYR